MDELTALRPVNLFSTTQQRTPPRLAMSVYTDSWLNRRLSKKKDFLTRDIAVSRPVSKQNEVKLAA